MLERLLRALATALNRWLARRATPARTGEITFKNEKGAGVGEITVHPGEANLSATVTALDAEGNPTTFDEVPTWSSSEEATAAVTASEDGYSATFAIGDTGSAVITVIGVESSSGERVEITSTGLINVAAADAVTGSVEFSVG